MGIRAPTAWAELQHHGFRTLPSGTLRGEQPTNWYIWEHVTGTPRFNPLLGGDIDLRNDDRGTVSAAYAREQRRLARQRRTNLRRGRFVRGVIQSRADRA